MLVSRALAIMLATTALALSTATARAAGDADGPLVLGRVPNPLTAIDELPAPPKLAAPDRGKAKLELHDYPGEYAQRFDGVNPGAKKPKRHFSGFVSRFSAGGRAK